jgi:hypothetical protein
MLSRFAFLSLFTIFLFCSNAYFVKYDTYLKNTIPKSLFFSDDKFEFKFLPVPNGIEFTIKNISGLTAFLIWNRSYFIDPSGNPTKAMNWDLLSTNEKSFVKENFESILPPNSTFTRFTTSVLNVNQFSNWSFYQQYAPLINTNYTFESYLKWYEGGKYWITSYLIPSDEKDIYDSILTDYVIRNNKLGLGLCIKVNDSLIDYRFDFKFSKIEVWDTVSRTYYFDSASIKIEPRIIKSAEESSGWKWQNMPTDSIICDSIQKYRALHPINNR